MAIYHCSIKIVKRSQGRSAVAAAAYRSGQKLTNAWDGITHDYTKKRGVVYSEILLPVHAPPNFSNRSTLWNSVEKIEKSRNAQLAREIEIALPVELDRQGIKKVPTVHMGVAATQMEHRGLSTEKGAVNREIAAQNGLLKEIKARITRLYNWSKQQAAQPEQKPSIWEQLQQTQNAIRPTTRYGKVKALKESAALFSFLQENGISSMQELHAKVTAMQTQYYTLRGEIAAIGRQTDRLDEKLSMWKQYSENRAFHQRLAALKPRARERFQDVHQTELLLYDAAARYLDELKASGERITPKEWRTETERLTVNEKALYQQMKAMRTDIQAVEKIRKTADELARSEKPRGREQEPER